LIELWELAKEAAEDARLLFQEGRYSSSVSRVYYAMFNAARALLAARGHRPDKVKRHATVLSLFSVEFVKEGPFDFEDGRALRRAEDARVAADYQTRLARGDAEQVINALNRFMQRAAETIDSEVGSGRQ
jgi:uncharacterized protein (UPF0332 family)